MMSNTLPTVCIVDDDTAIQMALLFLLKSEEIPAIAYSSAQEFLEKMPKTKIGALILDVRMPGMSGLELQQQLQLQNSHIPIIFLTGHSDIPMAVQAMKYGAIEFYEKPFKNESLLVSIRRCFEIEQQHDQNQANDKHAQQLVSQLTAREHEIMNVLVTGNTNKEIARELNISPRTVEVHRANIMRKLEANNLSDLVRLALRASPELL